jgi:hypothetical protein
MASLTSCECEDRIREAISNPGNRGSIALEDDATKSTTSSTSPRGPTESEPNDTRRAATSVSMKPHPQPMRGTIEGRDDVDWYELSLDDETWTLDVALSPRGDGLDPRLDLAVGHDDGTLQSYDVGGPGDSERIPVLRVGSSPTLIAVRGKGDTTGSYELTFEKRLSGGTIEAEPNDTRAVALDFPYPGEIQGFYDRPGDRDVYHVRRESLTDGIHSLQVTPTGDFPQSVELYTSRDASSPWVSFDVPPEQRHVLPNLHVQPSFQGLWIELSASDEYDREAGYRLRLLEHPPVEDDAIVLEGEPNDTRSRPQAVALGDDVRGYLHHPSDRDHFALEVGSAELEPSTTGDAGTDSEGRGRDAGPPSGEVPADDEAGMPPKHLEPSSPRDAGSSESSASADAEEGADASGPPNWRARLPDKSRPRHFVRVSLAPARDSDRLVLQWLREEGSNRTLRSPEEGEPVKICSHPLDRGILRFAVRGARLEERRIRRGFTYALAFRDLSSSTDDLELEPNDRRERADRLEMGRERTGHIDAADDQDVYAFAIPRSERTETPSPDAGEGATSKGAARAPSMGGSPNPSRPLEPTTVRVTLEGTKLNLAFDILDQAGARVAEVDRRGAGAGESMQIDLPPGLYYLRVESEREFSCDPYRIRIEQP